MPAPKDNDPDLCPNSGKQVKDGADERHGWLVCRHCTRALKQTKKVWSPLLQENMTCLSNHRVRGRNTASLDKTRDALVRSGIRPGGGL